VLLKAAPPFSQRWSRNAAAPTDEPGILSLLIKTRSIVVELGWFVWNRSPLVYIIETMCAIATAKEVLAIKGSVSHEPLQDRLIY
jgi:hypothetical protein